MNSYRFEIWLRTTDRTLADDIRGKIVEIMNPQNPGPTWQPRDFTHKAH